MAKPLFTTIDGWCGLTGMGRTATYEAIQRGDLKAHRVSDRKSLIDVERGMEWLRSRPLVSADVRPRSKRNSIAQVVETCDTGG